jgi:hypothetical protein
LSIRLSDRFRKTKFINSFWIGGVHCCKLKMEKNICGTKSWFWCRLLKKTHIQIKMNAKACLAGYCWNVDFLCKMNCKLNSDQITRITLNNKNKINWHKNSFSHTFSSLASIRFIENFLPVIQFRWTCKHPYILNVSISNVNNRT